MNTWGKWSIIVALVAVVVACGVKEESTIEGSHNYEGQMFPLVVHVYDSYGELNKAISKINNGPKVDGFTSWFIVKDDSKIMSDCEIHVVRPKGVKDVKVLETWGHELAHCIYGTYHKKGVR